MGICSVKTFGLAAAIAGGLTVAIGLAAPAAAAPSGAGNAQQIVSKLESEGYTVIVDHVGSTPLDQATVEAIRAGQTYSRTDSGNPGDNLLTVVTDKTVVCRREIASAGLAGRGFGAPPQTCERRARVGQIVGEFASAGAALSEFGHPNAV